MDSPGRNSYSSLWLFAILLLCPVIEPGGRRINAAEFYIYLSFLIGASSIVKNKYFYISTVYAVLFFVTCILTSVMAGSIINAHDVYMLRLMIQAAFCYSLFSKKIKETKDIDTFYFKSLFVVAIPSVIVFLQKINLFNFRGISKMLYSPKFFFLGGSVFDSYRYTSIFKDFFTAGIYFIIAGFFIFTYIQITKSSKKRKVIAGLVLGFVYVSQLYVARTSLIFIPFVCGLSYMISSRYSLAKKIKMGVVFIALAAPCLYFAVQIFINLGLVNEQWVMAGFDIFLANEGKSSSLQTLNEWNSQFFLNLMRDPTLLFLPKHSYNLSVLTDGHIYSDSFYVQEIYRYGIYGAMAYFTYTLLLAKSFLKDAKELLALLLVLVIINYKGGNVFFMPKVIYLLSFIIIVISTYAKMSSTALHSQNQQSELCDQ